MRIKKRQILCLVLNITGASVCYLAYTYVMDSTDSRYTPEGRTSRFTGLILPTALAIHPATLTRKNVPLQWNREPTSNKKLASKTQEQNSLNNASKNKSLAYCNPYKTLQTGTEGILRESYNLVNVHLLIRHGDRSSMYSLPVKDKETVSLACDKYNQQDEDVLSFLNFTTHLQQNNFLKIDGKKFPLRPDRTHCHGSELTPRGAMQHFYLGKYLRSKYLEISNSSLWSSSNFHSNFIYVRSTEYSRTFQSAVALILGLLQNTIYGKESLTINLHSVSTSMCSEQKTGFSCDCPMLKRLSKLKQSHYRKFISDNTLYKTIKAKMANVLNVASGKLPWIAAMLDALSPNLCHNMTFPCGEDKCITWNLVNQMWNFVENITDAENQNFIYTKANRLKAFPLMLEICHRLRNISAGLSVNKLSLYSGHDKTLAPVLTSLGIHDRTWTPYASRLIFELYKHTNINVSLRSVAYYIRIIYNGQDKTSECQMCSKTENGFCSLDHFCGHYENNELQYYLKDSYFEACQLQ